MSEYPAGQAKRRRIDDFCRIAILGSAVMSGCVAPPAPPPPAPAVTLETVDLVIAGTTDVHGRIRAWDYYTNSPETVRGLSRAATIVDSVRAANPGRVILLDAGDLLQGNPFADLAARDPSLVKNPIIAAMNAMNYDAATIGNHEFNYGVPYLDSAIAQARFPFLSDNIYKVNPANGEHAYRPWTIVTRAGVKVGIIGATTPGVMIWDARNILGRVTLGDIVPAVRQSVGEVRAAGADVIVVSVHSGLNERSEYDTATTQVPSENVAARIAAEVPGIDLILYGHSHKELKERVIGTTLLMEPKNWATSVSVAHLIVSRGSRGWAVTARHADLVQVTGHAESDTILALTRLAHQRTIDYVTRPIGKTNFYWRADSARLKDTPIIDFILEVERKVSGAQLASGGLFDSTPGIAPGAVTPAQIASLYIYANTLRSIRITGKQLRDYLEYSSRYYTGRLTADGKPETDPTIPGYNFDIVSGVNYVMDLNKPIGARITKLELNGVPVADTDSFTMAINNYRQGGGGGYSMIQGAPVVFENQQEIRDLLIAEVQRKGTLNPADYFVQNWILIPPAPAR